MTQYFTVWAYSWHIASLLPIFVTTSSTSTGRLWMMEIYVSKPASYRYCTKSTPATGNLPYNYCCKYWWLKCINKFWPHSWIYPATLWCRMFIVQQGLNSNLQNYFWDIFLGFVCQVPTPYGIYNVWQLELCALRLKLSLESLTETLLWEYSLGLWCMHKVLCYFLSVALVIGI